ncbi:phage neck terminator protein [Pseudomonas laurylsulfatiphila]|uniref:phage neck terminator protein n=1 Tax=Pseudomonas laurylsulfatiphila TaxID=2011015 RepID=UPI003D231453
MDIDVQKVQKIIDQCVLKPRYSYPMFKNAPRPPVAAYAAVRLMGTYSPGYDEVDNKFDEGTDEFVFTTKGFRILSFDVLFSRDDVDVDFLNNSFYRPDVLDLMKKLGMVLISKGPILVKTLTLESQWEVRTAIRLDFNVIRTQVTRIPRIVKAHIQGEFQEAETSLPIDIDITFTP